MKNTRRALALLALTASTFAEPQTETIPIGAKITITSTTGGFSAQLAYQWVRDETYIAGANSATYPVQSVTAADAGIYHVIATDEKGFERSNEIAIVIAYPPTGTPPVITAGPVSLVVPKKGTARFTVTATGEGLTYQWKKGLADIVGATSATLVIPNVKPPSAGQYIVTVSNESGYVKAGANLTVR